MTYQYISVARDDSIYALHRAQQLRNKKSATRNRRRREEIAHQKRTLLFTCIAVILGIVLAFSVLGTNAKATGADQATEPCYKYYKEVYVGSGDTLWSIASENTDGSVTEVKECVTEICTINNMNALDTLKSGTYIIVPYYSNVCLE